MFSITWGQVSIAIVHRSLHLASLVYFNCLLIELIWIFYSFCTKGIVIPNFPFLMNECVCAAWRDALRIMLVLCPQQETCLQDSHYQTGEASESNHSRHSWHTLVMKDSKFARNTPIRAIGREGNAYWTFFFPDWLAYIHRSCLHNNPVSLNLQTRSWSSRFHQLR